MTKMKKRYVVALPFAAASIIGIGAVACGGGGAEQPVTPAPQSEQQKTPSERGDLKEMKLRDKGGGYIEDVWIRAEIENRSSKKSDYMIDYEVVDKASGKRVTNSTMLVTSVLPGQNANQEDPVLLPQGKDVSDFKVNITEFDRTESF